MSLTISAKEVKETAMQFLMSIVLILILIHLLGTLQVHVISDGSFPEEEMDLVLLQKECMRMDHKLVKCITLLRLLPLSSKTSSWQTISDQ